MMQKSRRRYGGYIVHMGIIVMFIGFVGQAWGIDKETSMAPGDKTSIGNYEVTYLGPRMCPGNPKCSPEEQADISKRMIFADLEISRGGQVLGTVSPAKFIYTSRPEAPTTEVGLYRTLSEDLYTAVGVVNPQTKRATLQLHVNPLVSWIWLGVLVLIAGCGVSLWPEMRPGELGAWAYLRASAGATAGIAFSLFLAMSPATAYAQKRPPPVAAVNLTQPKTSETPALGVLLAVSAGLLGAGVTLVTRRRRGKAGGSSR
jgi:cytochrome c-type biogenesis protein CcmF